MGSGASRVGPPVALVAAVGVEDEFADDFGVAEHGDVEVLADDGDAGGLPASAELDGVHAGADLAAGADGCPGYDRLCFHHDSARGYFGAGRLNPHRGCAVVGLVWPVV